MKPYAVQFVVLVILLVLFRTLDNWKPLSAQVLPQETSYCAQRWLAAPVVNLETGQKFVSIIPASATPVAGRKDTNIYVTVDRPKNEVARCVRLEQPGPDTDQGWIGVLYIQEH